MTNANEEPFIRVRDAGAYLGIPVRTLYDLRQRGALPEPITITRKLKGWRRSTLNAFLDQTVGART